MIGKMLKGCVAAIAVLSVCTTIFAAELVDNPRYQEWSKYKPGTLVRMDVSAVAGGQNIKSTVTTTLKEVAGDKLVKNNSKMAGADTSMVLVEFKAVK